MNKHLPALHQLCFGSKDYPFKQRLLILCEYFLGFKYGGWPTGSSLESLDDFNYDLSTLDCVLYAEVVLALLKTEPCADFTQFTAQFEHTLRNIHYAKGVPSFLASNHIFCIDWIRNNYFLVNDITKRICAHTKLAETTIDKLTFFQRHSINKGCIPNYPERIIQLLAPQKSIVPYIEKEDLLNNYTNYMQKFPQYAMVVVVRPNWDLTDRIGTHLNISHLGFAIKDQVNQTINFFHATPEKNLVVQETLDVYMQRQLAIPTIGGINVQGISSGYYHAG